VVVDICGDTPISDIKKHVLTNLMCCHLLVDVHVTVIMCGIHTVKWHIYCYRLLLRIFFLFSTSFHFQSTSTFGQILKERTVREYKWSEQEARCPVQAPGC